ncbi:MAG: hypothetical protein WC071_05790 [Victivallaceae bacterium]
MDQVEYATDVLFKNPAALDGLYEKLQEHSIRCFGAKDALTFLGKKFDGRFTGNQIKSPDCTRRTMTEKIADAWIDCQGSTVKTLENNTGRKANYANGY